MPGIFGNNVLKCSPLVYNSGTGVLPILVLIFVLAQYRGLVLEYCFFWCSASTYFGISAWCTPNRKTAKIGKVHSRARVVCVV